MIEAASKLPASFYDHSIFVVVGGPPARAQQYREIGLKLGLHADKIIFIGPVDYKTSLLYYRAVDVIIIPLGPGEHARTTSPIKLFHTMAAGKALIVPDIPGLREYVDERMVVFYRVGDGADLARSIDELVHDPHRITEFAERLKQESAKYGWTSRAQRITMFL